MLFSLTCKCEPIGLVRRTNSVFDRFVQTFPFFRFVWGAPFGIRVLTLFPLGPCVLQLALSSFFLVRSKFTGLHRSCRRVGMRIFTPFLSAPYFYSTLSSIVPSAGLESRH